MKKRATTLLLWLIISLTLLFSEPFTPTTTVHAQESLSFGNPTTPPPANFTTFWQAFNKHSAWDLECNTGSGWFSVKQDLAIQKNYTTEDKCKITLIFDASYSGDYRLTFGIDLRVKNYTYQEAEAKYVLEYQNDTVYFDFTDLLAISGLTFTHGITEIAGVDVFWFRARRDNVPQGTHLELDPTFGRTSTSGTGQIFYDEDKLGCKFQYTDEYNGTGDYMGVYIYSDTGSASYGVMAVYSDDAGYPGNLLASTSTFTFGSSVEWKLKTFSSAPTFVTNTYYWFVVAIDTPSESYHGYVTRGTGSSGQGVLKSDITYALKDPFEAGGTMTDYQYSIYCSYTQEVPAEKHTPTIGEFTAPSTVYNDQYFMLYASINDDDGVSDFDYATIEISNDVVLKWTASTDVFTKYQDTYDWCVLDADGSTKTAINSTAYKLGWRIKLSKEQAEDSIDVVATNTHVYDIGGLGSSGSESSLFTFAYIPEEDSSSSGSSGSSGSSSGPITPPVEPPTTVQPVVPEPTPVNLVLVGTALIVGIVLYSVFGGQIGGGKLSRSRSSWKNSRKEASKRKSEWKQPKPTKKRWKPKKAWE